MSTLTPMQILDTIIEHSSHVRDESVSGCAAAALNCRGVARTGWCSGVTLEMHEKRPGSIPESCYLQLDMVTWLLGRRDHIPRDTPQMIMRRHRIKWGRSTDDWCGGIESSEGVSDESVIRRAAVASNCRGVEQTG